MRSPAGASGAVLQRQDVSTKDVLSWIARLVPTGAHTMGAPEIAMLLTPLGWDITFPDGIETRAQITAVNEGRVLLVEYSGTPFVMRFRRQEAAVPDGPRIAVIDLVSEGGGTLVRDGEHEPLGPGDMILYPPRGSHEIRWTTGHVRRTSIIMTTRVFGQTAGPVLRTSDIVLHDAPLLPAIKPLVAQLAAPSSAFVAAAAGRALEELVTATLATAIDRNVETAPSDLRARARDVLLARHPEQGLDATEVARELRISRRHLFAQYSGEHDTFANELRNIRLTHAAELLASPASDTTVRRVARDVGFSSAEQLSRVFRVRYGVPPAAYRADALTARHGQLARD